MIEVIVKNYLDTKLNLPIYLERPKNTPDSFVLFEKTGSTKTNHLNSCNIAFQSYAKTLFEAAQLNEKLKSVVEDMILIDDIASVKLISDYNFTNPETKEYRYQAVYTIKF